jgi:hypothetical protein
MTSSSSPQTSSLQTAIEVVEALSESEQDLLFDLIQKRRRGDRRQALLQRSIEVQNAFQQGTAKVGTMQDLIADIIGDSEE